MIYHDFAAERPMSFSFFRSNFQGKTCWANSLVWDFSSGQLFLFFLHLFKHFFLDAFIVFFCQKYTKREWFYFTRAPLLTQDKLLTSINMERINTFSFSFFSFVWSVRILSFIRCLHQNQDILMNILMITMVMGILR